jgi:hypothetical protein
MKVRQEQMFRFTCDIETISISSAIQWIKELFFGGKIIVGLIVMLEVGTESFLCANVPIKLPRPLLRVAFFPISK